MRRTFALALPLLALACSLEEPPIVPARISRNVGGFAIAIANADRLVISASDGRALLDGLNPGPVVGDAAPLVGFAVRDRTTSYEMKFGSFKPTEHDGGPWRVASALGFSASDSSIDVRDASGRSLAKLTLASPDEGHLSIALEPGEGTERRFSWGFLCDERDHFMGFGAQSFDVDHRGQTIPTFVQEQGIGKTESDDYDGAWFLEGRKHASQIPIAEYLSRRGYALVAETPRRSIFALCSESAEAARIEVDLPAKIHVFDGPSPSKALERASLSFGRPRMPPRVAFAPWNDAVGGSKAVRAVAAALRDAKVPSSVIWSEDWRGGELKASGNYTLKEEWEVDTTLYPDFPQLANDLHDSGFDFHVYFNSFVYEGSKAWTETQPKGYLVKNADGSDYVFLGAKFTNTGLLDLDNPDARAWAVDKMRKAIALGADGWMNDYAEWLPTDGKTAAGPSLERHNEYPVLWQQTAREAIDGVNDGHERLFFSRSGWLGSPALADVVWAGDQRTDMERDDGLPTVLPIGIGCGIVGLSTFGHDIAGYQSATNAPSNKEVFFRWTELGALSPVMRTHHGTVPAKEWSWSRDAETIAHFRRYATLHMALVPFFEGLAKNASRTGLPIWHGLALDFPEDDAAWPVTDQVLVGGRLLVAPVMTPGAVSRDVYFPASRWFPWESGASFEGPVHRSVDAPLGEIPLYARAGTIVPMYPDGVMTLVRGSAAVPGPESVGDDRVVRVFLGDAGSFEEASGLRYSLDHLADASGALSYRFAGADLQNCATMGASGCVAVADASSAVVHVSGPGVLEVVAGGVTTDRLRVEGGANTRKISLFVRR